MVYCTCIVELGGLLYGCRRRVGRVYCTGVVVEWGGSTVQVFS